MHIKTYKYVCLYVYTHKYYVLRFCIYASFCGECHVQIFSSKRLLQYFLKFIIFAIIEVILCTDIQSEIQMQNCRLYVYAQVNIKNQPDLTTYMMMKQVISPKCCNKPFGQKTNLYKEFNPQKPRQNTILNDIHTHTQTHTCVRSARKDTHIQRLL